MQYREELSKEQDWSKKTGILQEGENYRSFFGEGINIILDQDMVKIQLVFQDRFDKILTYLTNVMRLPSSRSKTNSYSFSLPTGHQTSYTRQHRGINFGMKTIFIPLI